MPRWRAVCSRLDRSLRLMCDSTYNTDGSWPERLATTLAELAGPAATLVAAEPPCPELRAWVGQLISNLTERVGPAISLRRFADSENEFPPRLMELNTWARALEARLDEWFEVAAAHSLRAGAEAVLQSRRQVCACVPLRKLGEAEVVENAGLLVLAIAGAASEPAAHWSWCVPPQMSEVLLAVLTGRSALAFLEAALRSEWARESHPLEQLWHRVGVPHAIERVDIRQ